LLSVVKKVMEKDKKKGRIRTKLDAVQSAVKFVLNLDMASNVVNVSAIVDKGEKMDKNKVGCSGI
jgi:hypothetical protein